MPSSSSIHPSIHPPSSIDSKRKNLLVLLQQEISPHLSDASLKERSHFTDGKAESREATQPCRTERQEVQDINPNPHSPNTPDFDTKDRAKLSHHHLLSFAVFFFLSFSQNLCPLMCQRSHTSPPWHLWHWPPGLLSPARCQAASFPSPAFLALGLRPQGLRVWPPSTTFSAGHFLLRAALASCLSLTRIVTEIVSAELYLSGHRCLPPWQTPPLPAVPHLPEAFFFLPRSPSSRVAED